MVLFNYNEKNLKLALDESNLSMEEKALVDELQGFQSEWLCFIIGMSVRSILIFYFGGH